MTRYFTDIPNAVKWVIEQTEDSEGGEIRIPVLEEKVNILELAREIIKKSGKNVGIKMIGIRPGEALEERLMTDEESKIATKNKKGDSWIIK